MAVAKRGHRRGGKPVSAASTPATSPLRTCVVTREERAPADLVRIALLEGGVVVVDRSKKLPGAGVWVIPDAEAFGQLVSKPSLLQRAFEQPVVGADTLLEQARAACDNHVWDLLSLCARSGRIASGADQAAAAVREGDAVAIVVADDASSQSISAILGAGSELPMFVLPVPRDELGRRVGKGPRAGLVIRRGGPADALLRELRRWVRLR